jgi:hypothetical protein
MTELLARRSGTGRKKEKGKKKEAWDVLFCSEAVFVGGWYKLGQTSK